jgi:hypothetical protein
MAMIERVACTLQPFWDRIFKSWFWPVILFPYLTTRAALIVAGLGSEFFINYPGINPTDIPQRGWWFTSHTLLDMWLRWDTGWYLSIIEHGYTINGDLATQQNNVVFYPLYPMMVKACSYLLPAAWIHPKIYLAIGVILSNILLIFGLFLLYKLIRDFLFDHEVAEKTIGYLLFFPTGFFFSAFYTESAFLFFSVATVYACLKKRWWLAGVCSFLLALCRPTGVLILIVTGWLYMDSIEWKLKRIRLPVLWLGLAPLGWASFQLYIYSLAGVWGASFLNQQAWNRYFSFNPFSYITMVIQDPIPAHKIPLIFALGFLALSVVAFWRLPSKGYALFSLALIIIPFYSGKDTSVMRYFLGVFPVFITLALLVSKRPKLDTFFKTVFFSLQIIYMAGWFNFYPVM